jgi:hypothetical protein
MLEGKLLLMLHWISIFGGLLIMMGYHARSEALEGFRAYSRNYGCPKPSVKVFVQRYLGPFQKQEWMIARQSTSTPDTRPR